MAVSITSICQQAAIERILEETSLCVVYHVQQGDIDITGNFTLTSYIKDGSARTLQDGIIVLLFGELNRLFPDAAYDGHCIFIETTLEHDFLVMSLLIFKQ